MSARSERPARRRLRHALIGILALPRLVGTQPPARPTPPVDSATRVHLDSLVELAESYLVYETRIARSNEWTATLANGGTFRALERLPYIRNGTPGMLICRTAADCHLWAFGEGTYVGVAPREPPPSEARQARWMTLDAVRGRGTVLVMMSGAMYAVPNQPTVTKEWRPRSSIVVLDARRAVCLDCYGPYRAVEVTPIR